MTNNIEDIEAHGLLVIRPTTETKQTSPFYAAARLWVDNIIDPIETRQVIAEGIAAANQNPHMDSFSTGVFQV